LTDLRPFPNARRVVDDATSITRADLQRPRDLGLSDTDIMDVVLAAAARCFLLEDARPLDMRPEASYRHLDPDLQEAFVGRPPPYRLRVERSGGHQSPTP
jgi:hypothetical protein